MSHNELKIKVKELRELKELAAELHDNITAIEDDIKAFMGEQEEINIDGIKVRYTNCTSSRFDSKAFKAEHAAMYAQYEKKTLYRRFSVA